MRRHRGEPFGASVTQRLALAYWCGDIQAQARALRRAGGAAVAAAPPEAAAVAVCRGRSCRNGEIDLA